MRHIYYVIYIIYLLLIAFLVFFDKRKPMKRIGWILTLVFLPGLGLLLYWLMGSSYLSVYQKKKTQKLHGDVLYQIENIINENSDRFRTPLSKAARFHQKYCISTFTNDNCVEIHTTGTHKFDSLFKDINAAQDSIHIIYFTIHNDGMGKKLINTLIEKVNQGVEVKLLYDRFGCLTTFTYPLVRRLKKAGGEVFSIRPYTHTINYRNHRKIVIVDGKIGYLGGFNVGDRYQFGIKGHSWRDTHVRVTGSMVYYLQKVFLSDLAASVKKNDLGLRHDLQHYFPLPNAKGSIKSQIVANGLYDNNNHEIINLSYFNLINLAQKRIWIQTPYFRPSDIMLAALKTAAVTGVDVRLMLSLNYASGGIFNRSLNRYFLRKLSGSGVKVYGYKDIMHAKTMLIDDYGLCIGTVNLNTRSLEIDDEIYGYFESISLAKQYEQIFNDDLDNCIEIDKFKPEEHNLIARAIESLLSFLTPLS